MLNHLNHRHLGQLVEVCHVSTYNGISDHSDRIRGTLRSVDSVGLVLRPADVEFDAAIPWAAVKFVAISRA